MQKKAVLLFILIFIPSYSQAFDLYVNSIKATIYHDPSIGSKKITVLSKGIKIQGLKLEGYWYKVVHNGVAGWVYKFMVKKTPPIDSNNLYAKLRSSFSRGRSLGQSARKRPSAYTTTAAARGLKEKRKRFSSKYLLDYDSLEKMEAIEISPQDALGFLEEGVSK